MKSIEEQPVGAETAQEKDVEIPAKAEVEASPEKLGENALEAAKDLIAEEEAALEKKANFREKALAIAAILSIPVIAKAISIYGFGHEIDPSSQISIAVAVSQVGSTIAFLKAVSVNSKINSMTGRISKLREKFNLPAKAEGKENKKS